MPREAAGIRLDQIPRSQPATELAREASAPTLFNHAAVRIYSAGSSANRKLRNSMKSYCHLVVCNSARSGADRAVHG